MVPQFENMVQEIKLPFSSFESHTSLETIIAGIRQKPMNRRFIRGNIEIETSLNSRDHTELKVIKEVNIIKSSFVNGLSSNAALGKMSFMQ